MTANEIYQSMKEMNNMERNKFLDMIYDEYFDTGMTAEQREKIIEILEAYENGELVER